MDTTNASPAPNTIAALDAAMDRFHTLVSMMGYATPVAR